MDGATEMMMWKTERWIGEHGHCALALAEKAGVVEMYLKLGERKLIGVSIAEAAFLLDALPGALAAADRRMEERAAFDPFADICGPVSVPPPVSVPATSGAPGAVARPAPRPRRQGAPWTPTEEARLLALHADEMPRDAIANELGRSVRAIDRRLERLGAAQPPESASRQATGHVNPAA